MNRVNPHEADPLDFMPAGRAGLNLVPHGG